jgi:leucyl aminopeptidase (aminopeptidase T)
MKLENDMQQATAQNVPIPLPKGKKETVLIQAEVDIDLVNAVKKELKRTGANHMRLAIIYGLKRYLFESNPAEAKKLGITDKE